MLETLIIGRVYRVALLAWLLSLGCTGVAPEQSQGRAFTTRYGQANAPGLAAIRQELADGRVLEEFATGLERVLRFPRGVELALDECGSANAMYLAEQRSIVLCYELLISIVADAATRGQSEEEIEQITGGTLVFVLFHELGHALIDLLDLPTTGREEDAVDQLATLLMTDGSDEGAVAAAHAAVWFYRAEEGVRLTKLAFADEHSLGKQRYYSILCWVYGQDPSRHRDLVELGILPESRASECPAEYQRISKAWETFLKPYLREQ